MSGDRVPIIRVDGNLLVSLPGDLDDAAVLQTEREITDEVARTRASGLIIDVSGLTIVDSFMARVIARMVSLVYLLGSRAVVVGIQPTVAMAMVELGVNLRDVHTALNPGKGMELLRRLAAAES